MKTYYYCSENFLEIALTLYCRNLREFELTLALDATEEGLLALAGRSVLRRDQGYHKHWDNALYMHKVQLATSLKFYYHEEGTYKGLLLVESAFYILRHYAKLVLTHDK